jgi:hypothetical protein
MRRYWVYALRAGMIGATAAARAQQGPDDFPNEMVGTFRVGLAP